MKTHSLLTIIARIMAACESAATVNACEEKKMGCVLCNKCFGKIRNQYNRTTIANPSFSAGISRLLKHLEVFNDNYNSLELMKNEMYPEATEVLYGSVQEPLFTIIYDIEFKSPKDLEQMGAYLAEYCGLSTNYCKVAMENMLLFYNQFSSQIVRMFELDRIAKFKPESNSKQNFGCRKNHTLHYGLYRDFIDAKSNDVDLVEYTKQTRLEMRTRFYNNVKSIICIQFYEAMVSKLLESGEVTDQLVCEAIYPYVFGSDKNIGKVKAISFCVVYLLIDRDIESEDLRKNVKSAIRAILLKIESGDVYNMLRIYKLYQKLPFADFADFTLLVLDRISNLSDNDGRTHLMNLHGQLVLASLPCYCESPLCADNLLCLYKLKSGIPGIASEIDHIESEYICAGLNRNILSIHLLQILDGFCKTGGFHALENFCSKLCLTGAQAFALLVTVSEYICEMDTKLCILYELVNCNVLNYDCHNYIMQSFRGNFLTVTTYALALASYTHKANKTDPMLLNNGVSEMYLHLHVDYPSIFNDAHGVASPVHYLLHAFEISIISCSSNEAFRKDWQESVYLNYSVNFFTSLWASLNVSREVSIDNPCYPELCEMRMLAFRILKSYADTQKSPSVTQNASSATPSSLSATQNALLVAMPSESLLNKPLDDLFRLSIPPLDIYTDYLQSDPSDANYLIIRYFLYYCTHRDAYFHIKRLADLHDSDKKRLIEYLSRLTPETFKAAPNLEIGIKLQIREIGSLINKWCQEAFVPDAQLSRLIEAAVLNIAYTWSDAVSLANSVFPANSGRTREMDAIMRLHQLLLKL